MLELAHVFQLDAEAFECLGRRPLECQVLQRVAQKPTHEELERQVADATRVGLVAGRIRETAPFHQAVADRVGKRLVDHR